MVTIAICVGSSCHLKNSYDVINAFQEEVRERHLEDEVKLSAAFCLGKCGLAGVSMKVNDKIVTGVTTSNYKEVFDKEVLPLLAKGE